MNAFEQARHIREAHALMDRIEEIVHHIMASVEAERLKRAT